VFHGSPRINLQNRRFFVLGFAPSAPTGVAGALRQRRRCGREADIDPWKHLLTTAVALVIDELTTELEGPSALALIVCRDSPKVAVTNACR
jgi:hypothetical protein